jgi:uncharacterized protein (DUF58 family)
MPVSTSSLRDQNSDRSSHQKLTGRGGFLLAFSVLALSVGIVLPEPHAVHLGLLGLLLLGIAWPLTRGNLRGLSVSRMTPESAYAGQAFPLEITLQNDRRKFDAFAIEYEDSISGPSERGLHAAWVQSGGKVQRMFKTRLLRRGLKHRVRGSLASTFPLGLWRAQQEIKDVLEMVIIPRPITPRILDDPEFTSLLEADDSESIQLDYSGDFHGLREFQPGDRVKQIDWPATARSGKIMVRKFDRRLPSRFLIVFHSLVGKSKTAHGEAFDAAMEMLCGLLLGLHERGIPMDLIASFNDWKLQPVGGTAQHLQAGLRLLADARRAPEHDFSRLQRVLANVDSSQRVFLMSDVPVKDWEAFVPEVPCLVTCLSVSELRVRQPQLYVKK